MAQQFSYQNLLDAGFSEQEARKAFTDKLTAAGFSQSEINAHLNNVSGVRPASLAGDEQNEGIKVWAKNIDEFAAEAHRTGMNLNFWDAIRRGFEQSVMGMLKEGKLPRELTPEEEASLNFFERLAMGASEVISDTPIYFAGGKVGALATGAAGAAIGTVAPGVGNAVGGGVGLAVGGAAGAFGFHRAARTVLIDMYQRGEVADFDELVYRVTHASKEFGKGAAVGAVVGGAGKAAAVGSKALKGAAAARTGASAMALNAGAKVAPVGSEILGLTVAGAAVEGQVPTAQDFVDSAAMILTLKGVHKAGDAATNKLKNTVVNNLYSRFIENGEHPADVIKKATNDPLELQKVLEEKRKVRDGWEEVKYKPLEGTREGKDDALVKLLSGGIKEYIINRGAAIKDPKTGDIIVQGPELAKATGTNRNFGFSKMIFKHGITAEEAQLLPEIVRDYNPITEGKDTVFRIPKDENHNYRIVFKENKDGENRLITMMTERVSKKNPKELSTKKEVAIPAAASAHGEKLDTSTQDTVRDGFAPDVRANENINTTPESATSTDSIAKKAAEIKGQLNPTEQPQADKQNASAPAPTHNLEDLHKKFREKHPTADAGDRETLIGFLLQELTPEALEVPQTGQVKAGDLVLIKRGKKLAFKEVTSAQGDALKLDGSTKMFFTKDVLVPNKAFTVVRENGKSYFDWPKLNALSKERLGVDDKTFNSMREWLERENPISTAGTATGPEDGPKYNYKVVKAERAGLTQAQREHIAQEIINNVEGSLFSRFDVKKTNSDRPYTANHNAYWVDDTGKSSSLPKTAQEQAKRYRSNPQEYIKVSIPDTKATLTVRKDPLAVRALFKELGISITAKKEYAADKMYSTGGGDFAASAPAQEDLFAYKQPGYNYRVQFPFEPKEALPNGKVSAEDATAKRSIIESLQKVFNVPVRGWKVPRQGRGAMGLFYSKPEMIRVKYANDLTTTVHELGHYLEKKMYGKVASDDTNTYYEELHKFATKPRGGATKHKIAAEGFAQFLSTYVVNPKVAKEGAPMFYNRFESDLREKEPEIYRALQDARAQVEKFVKQPAVMEVLSNVSVRDNGKPTLTAAEKWRAIKNYVKVKWFDDKAPLLRVVEQLEKESGKKIDFANNPYYLARLFPGWVGRAEAFVEHGTFDYNTLQDTGKSLKAILQPVENLDELRAYLVSKRALEIAKRDPTKDMSGIRPEAALQTVKELEGKYKGVAEELYNYQNALLKYQLDGGLISEETYLKVLKSNKSRVPFYRVMEDGKDYALGSRVLSGKQVLKRLKGSSRTIIDPLESIIKDTYETINAVERNRVGQALANLAEMEGAGKFVFRIDNPVKTVTSFDDGLEHFTASQTIDKNNQIKVFEHGKARIYEVDKDVAALINGLNPNEANAFLRIAGFFTQSLRAGATIYNLSFSPRNLMRDIQFAFTNTTSKFNPFKSIIGNFKSAITKDEAYWQFKKAGADQASFFSVDRNSLQKELLTLEQTGYAKSVWNLVTAKEFAAAWEAGVLEPLRYPGEVGELSTRLGEFKSSIKQHGTSKEGLEKAAYNARSITIDFARAGIHGRALNMVSAFFNANVQGADKTVETLHLHPLKTLSFLGTLGILEAIINYDWKNGKEDADIAEVNRAQRNLNYVFKVGDTIYRVPKEQQIGIVSTLFSQMTTAALDAMNKNERDDFMRNAASAFANEFDMNPMPNALAVPIELWANKSFFFNRSIVPAAAENVLPEYQYTQKTTELTKFISSKLGGWVGKENTFSPAKAEYLVRGWTGGVGTAILQATDFACRKAGIVPDPVKPAATVNDIPFVRAFVIRHPSSSPESVQRFYDEYKNRMEKYNSFKAMGKQMNIGEYNALTPYAAYGGLNAIYRGMSENSAAIRNIYNNPEMSADEKRQNIDQLYLVQLEQAKAGLGLIKQLDEEINNNKGAQE